MEELITRNIGNRELIFNALESVELYIKESPEIQLVIASLLFIIIVSLWTLYERLEINGWKSLIPVYRWVVLFKALGMKPWLSLFMLIPGINIIMIVVVYINIARVFKRSYFIVPFLFICPLIFIPIVAFGNGKCDHYQPHARYVDNPVVTKKRQPVVVRQRKTLERATAQNTIKKNTLIYKTAYTPKNIRTRQLQIKADRPAVATPISQQAQKKASTRIKSSVKVLSKGKPIAITPKMIRKKRHIDFVSKTRRRVAKPVENVLPNRQVRKVTQPISTIQPQIQKPTRPIPGDIRPMKSNIVVVGTLMEVPKRDLPHVKPSLHQVS